MAMNLDADILQADWVRVIARMRTIAAEHPELTETEIRVAAEREHNRVRRRKISVE